MYGVGYGTALQLEHPDELCSSGGKALTRLEICLLSFRLHDCAGRVTRRKDTTKRLAHNKRTPVPRTLPMYRLFPRVGE